jgi:diguanylate cyclase (GGDEF)-like protein/PAS domain S-box-containing protein
MSRQPGTPRNTDNWWRWTPWVLLGLGLAVTALAASLRLAAENRQTIDETAVAEDRFRGEVSTISSSMVTEQSKLVFLMESIAGWSAGMGVDDSEGFRAFIESLDLQTKTPAISGVTVVRVSDSGSVAVLNSSVPGVGIESSILGTEVGSQQGVAELLQRAESNGGVVIGVPVDLHGATELALARRVAEDSDSFAIVTFRADVFLMPALLNGNGVQPMLISEEENFPVIAPADGVIRPRVGAQLTLPEWTAEYPGRSEVSELDVIRRVRLDDESGERFITSTSVAVMDQQWELWVGSDSGLTSGSSSRDPWIIAIAGLLLSLAAFFVVRALARVVGAQAAFAEELRRSNRRFATGFENAPIGMAEVTSTGAFIRVNKAMIDLLGYSALELAELSLFDLVHPEDQTTHARRIGGVLDGTARAAHTEVRYWSRDGWERRIDESMSALEQEGDRHLLVQAKDVTRQREVEQELMRQALHDELTGLPNRALLFDRMRHALETRAPGSEVGVLFIDLDQFKIVNDSLGHTAGDRLLTVVANRILGCVAEGDTVARFGGDEFVVVCDEVEDQASVLRVADAIRAAVKRPVELAGSAFQVTASIGATFAVNGLATPESLLRDADSAMYQAKDTGRDRVAIFHDTLWIAAVQRLDLESALRRAVEHEEFRVHYQPVISLAAGDIVGFEALVRWEHPDRGLLWPDEFLNVAEEAGLLDEMDRATLRAACTQFAEWSSNSVRADTWRLSVNCSPRWFQDLSLVESLPELLLGSGLDPSRLCLEVTERMLVEDADRARAVISRLHALGVRVAIDDFGTGYSSLSYLAQLSVDFLKIDRSFIEKLGTDVASDAITTAVIEMAIALDIPTIAEGVETTEQLERLRDMGATYVQGNLVSEPLPANDVNDALARVAEHF